MDETERIEALLAEALAAFDEGGDESLQRFVAAHAADRTRLLRGIERCREMGLLGQSAAAREFPEQLGEFRLLRRLGGGGMGVVYEAEQISLSRRVALKVVRPELLFFEGARERFRREIEAVARLSHPAVVPVLASGEQDGVPYYVMELLTGRTLSEVAAAFAGRDPAELHGSELRAHLGGGEAEATDPFAGPWWTACVRAIHAIALGVRHAHLRGIVHRDIKPSNVMLTTHGQAVLLDFGIASVQGGREFTRSGQTPGSPAFMSPEQLRGAAVDERTDVYSLAATLWQVLALQAPFRGVEDLQRIRDGEIPSLRARNRAVPPELEIVVQKAMDRDRERRYPDMDAFAADLQAVLQRRPIAARRLGLGLRLLRWSQRHRAASTAMVAVLVATAGLPLVLAWRTRAANVQLEAARTVAEENLDQTLQVLASVLLRLGHERLRGIPAAEQMAIDSLEDTVRHYRSLLQRLPDHVRLRKDAARGISSLAGAYARTGRDEDAIARYREALALLSDDATEPELVDGRAHVEMNFGSILRATSAPGADAMLEAAERDFRAVLDLPQQRPTALRGLCVIATLRANEWLPSRRDDIQRERRNAVQFAREHVALEPKDAQAKGVLVQRLDDLATFLVRNGAREEGHRLLEEALGIAGSLRAEPELWPTGDMLVADVLQTQGIAFTDAKDKRAVEALTECLRLREQLVAKYPADVEVRTAHAGSLSNLARLDYFLARDEDAIQGFRRAADLLQAVLAESPRQRTAREFLAATLNQLGQCHVQRKDVDALLRTTDELARVGTTGPLRTAARQKLRAIELLAATNPQPADFAERRAAIARAALDLLLEAEQQGWGTGNRLDEPIYAPLAEFPEFEGLRGRVRARAAGG